MLAGYQTFTWNTDSCQFFLLFQFWAGGFEIIAFGLLSMKNNNNRNCMKVSNKLRTYPMPFAQAIVNLRDDLVASRPMEPVISHDLPSGPEILDSMPDDDGSLFSTADLSSCYRYLRCGKGLKLPQHWRRFMPLEVPLTVPFLERDP